MALRHWRSLVTWLKLFYIKQFGAEKLADSKYEPRRMGWVRAPWPSQKWSGNDICQLDCRMSHAGGKKSLNFINGKFIIGFNWRIKRRKWEYFRLKFLCDLGFQASKISPRKTKMARTGQSRNKCCLCLLSLWSILWDKNSSTSDLFKVILGNSSRKVGKLG